MAVDYNYLKLLVPGGNGHPNIWSYKTADAAGTVDTDAYFAGGYNYGLRVYDIIIRTTVTNLGASNEAYASQGFHTVSTATATSLDVNDTLAITATDTD